MTEKVAKTGGRDRGRRGALAVALGFYAYNAWVTHFPSYAVRHAFLRRVLGIRLGEGAAVHMGCFFTGNHVEIGERSVVNRNCYLDGRVGLRIGRDVSVSPEAYLVSLSHDPQSPDFATAGAPIAIGDRAWIGARAMVMPGVSVGEGAVVGAGSVVTRDVEPFAVAAGVPARKVGERSRDLRYSLGYRPYFNTDVLPG